jgi:hypothetical protein
MKKIFAYGHTNEDRWEDNIICAFIYDWFNDSAIQLYGAEW